MKPHHFLLSVIFSCFFSFVFAQEKMSHKAVIEKNQEDGTEMLLNKERMLLIREIKNNNIDNAKTIYQRMLSRVDTSDYYAFLYHEEIAILALFEDWDSFLHMASDIMNLGSRLNCCYDITPINRQLRVLLTRRASDLIKSAVDSPLRIDEAYLIFLYLSTFKDNFTYDSHVRRFNYFRKTYKNNEYQIFAKRYLEQRHAISYTFGVQSILLNKKLSNLFDALNVFSCSLDHNLRNLYISSSLSLGFPVPKGNFAERLKMMGLSDRFSFIGIELRGGYFFRNKYFHLAPYIQLGNVGLHSYDVSDSDNEEKRFDVINSITIGSGLHTKLKLIDYFPKNNAPGYFSLALTGGVKSAPLNTNFEEIYTLPYLEFGIAWGIGYF